MAPHPTATKTLIAAQLAAFVVAAALLIPAITPGAAAVGAAATKLLFLARMAVLVALAHWLLRQRSLRWSDVGLHRPSWRRFAFALAAGLVLAGICFVAAQALAARLGLPMPNYAAFAPIRGNLWQYLFWVGPVTLGTAALGEELAFRGFVMDAVRRLCGGSGVVASVLAVAGQAVLFGVLHAYQGPGGMMMAGAIGLALGLTRLVAGGNLWSGFVIHALLDGSAMTAIYLGYVAT